MSEPIYQLVYISAAEHEFTKNELEILLAKARDNNQNLGISGMLLYHNGSFIQALEGPKVVVEKLYSKIAQDTRHRETQVLFRGELEERDFNGWSMGFYRSNQTSDQNLEGFHTFLQTGFRSNLDAKESKARKALLQFREGNWRQNVDTGTDV